MIKKKVLILLAHPDIKQSLSNRIIIERLSAHEAVTARSLYALYPDFKIDVEAEQEALLGIDLLIFQFPLYWYSSPALLKEWQDKVLTYGFAYGAQEHKLKGMSLLISLTIGSEADTYHAGHSNQYTLDELLRPFQQTANFCEMVYRGYIQSNAMNETIKRSTDSYPAAEEHAKRLINFIEDFFKTP